MKSFTVVAVFLTVALAAFVSAEQETREGLPVVYDYENGVDKCPAKAFWHDCNSCSCGDDGKSAACTRMACPPRQGKQVVPKASGEVPVVHNYKFGDKCPAKFFKADCNFCTCLDDGHSAACTLMACPPVNDNNDVKKSVENNEVEDIPRVNNYEPGQKCPAKVFYLDCNRCVCARDGKRALCTLMACPEKK